MSKKYLVSVKFEGRAAYHLVADTTQDAEEKAKTLFRKFFKEHLGYLQIVDIDPCFIDTVK